MNDTLGTENQRWTVTCQDAPDGTGDMFVPLPDDLLNEIGLAVGDTLDIEKKPDGTIPLTPIRS